MCGIFGVVGNEKILPQKLERVSKILKHRGPDDEGCLIFNDVGYQLLGGDDTIEQIKVPHFSGYSYEHAFNCAFLHRRLSIIDLTPTGHQPMSYHKNRLWIIFNGEIYNYLEIRKELENKGYHFLTTSDTEVVLASYAEWGSECVNHFNGMWAFSIWDKEKKLLFLSRDRFGIKPLYYYFHNRTLIFCSEIKGIREYLGKELTLNRDQLISYAVKGVIQIGESTETIYNQIKSLPAGRSLVYDFNDIRIEKFWKLDLHENTDSFEDNSAKFRELFIKSIHYRFRSDVEVGSCLSGGLDSSSIVSVGSSVFNKRIHTFSAIWPGEECDESFYIKKVNEKWNCRDHTFIPDISHFFSTHERVIWHQEMPLPGTSLLAQWFVMEEAHKNNIKVLLDGQGADEILGGYPRYVPTYFYELVSRIHFPSLLSQYGNFKRYGYHPKRMIRLMLNKMKAPIADSLPILKSVNNPEKFNNKYIPEKYNRVAAYQKDEIEKSCLPQLLHVEDSNSMAHSVESRVPFLDYNLVAFAINIPAVQKFNGPVTKMILREGMKEFVPAEVYNRTDKIGFETPIEKNISRIDTVKIREIINDSKLWNMEIIDRKKSGADLTGELLFRLFSLASFTDMWI